MSLTTLKAKITAATTTLSLAALLFPAVASAATTVVVHPGDTGGWASADTRPGGTIDYVEASDAPLGEGALRLQTDETNNAKAQYMTDNNLGTPLADVTDLSYWTKQVAASSAGGSASFQLAVDLDGDISTEEGFTTLVYEPYWQNSASPDPAPVEADTWQQWDVDAGVFWSSRTVGGLTAGAGGPPLYSLADVLALNPDAVVLAFGVNVGTFNPNYEVLVDGVVFNDTTYDFELEVPVYINEPTSKDDCKKGGWESLTGADGTPFKNQGDCVSYVATQGKNQPSGNPVVRFLQSLF